MLDAAIVMTVAEEHLPVQPGRHTWLSRQRLHSLLSKLVPLKDNEVRVPSMPLFAPICPWSVNSAAPAPSPQPPSTPYPPCPSQVYPVLCAFFSLYFVSVTCCKWRLPSVPVASIYIHAAAQVCSCSIPS